MGFGCQACIQYRGKKYLAWLLLLVAERPVLRFRLPGMATMSMTAVFRIIEAVTIYQAFYFSLGIMDKPQPIIDAFTPAGFGTHVEQIYRGSGGSNQERNLAH